MEQRIKQPSNCYCSEMTGVEQMKQEKAIIIGAWPMRVISCHCIQANWD